MRHLGEEVEEFVLGTLPAAEQAELEAHVRGCDECAALAASATEALAMLALAAPPIAPEAGGRARLLAAATGSNRFGQLLSAVAKFFDLAADQTSKLLDSIDHLASWEDGPMLGLKLIHLEGGPAVAGADSGFVKMPAGTPFPIHTHLGEERALLLQGSLREDNGTVRGPGDTITMGVGTWHSFDVLEGPDLIYALVLFRGIEFRDGGSIRSRNK